MFNCEIAARHETQPNQKNLKLEFPSSNEFHIYFATLEENITYQSKSVVLEFLIIMLSKQAIKRLDRNYKLLTFCCIIPCDWDRKTRRLTRTRNKLKLFINQLIILFLSFTLMYFCFCLLIDINFGFLTVKSMLICVLFYGSLVLLWSVAICSHLYAKELVFLINNAFFMDQYFRGKSINHTLLND